MDLIWTNTAHVPQGELVSPALDLQYGDEQNDFELTHATPGLLLSDGCYIGAEGTEFGGRVDAVRITVDDGHALYTLTGRTWHGLLAGKILQPDSGADRLTVSGDANNIIRTIISRIGLSTVFDVPMEEAVKSFQQIFNLTPDGVVGKATWYKIKQIYNGVKQLSDLSSEGLTIPEVQRRYAEDLRLGDSGIDVRTVRFYLAFLGYFLPELPMISLSDDFDQELLDAVYTFQRVYGLPVDGVVGRETWNALQTAYQKVLAELPEDYRQFAGEVYPGRFLVRGDRGEQVALMQERLNQISREDETLPSLVVDGIFGPATQQAVLTLQRQLGFDPTGAVGPVLWAQIITLGEEY